MTRTSAPPRSFDIEKVMITTPDLYRAAWASSLGSALEYYDFALYSLASALIFGPLFFPAQGPAIGLIASFSTYFLGFAIRPVGGIIFWHYRRSARSQVRTLGHDHPDGGRQHANWCAADLRQRRLLGSAHACRSAPAARVGSRR